MKNWEDEYNDNENYNQDWERQNDLQDSLKKGRECNGCYCGNCDLFNSCSNSIKYESLL